MMKMLQPRRPTPAGPFRARARLRQSPAASASTRHIATRHDAAYKATPITHRVRPPSTPPIH